MNRQAVGLLGACLASRSARRAGRRIEAATPPPAKPIQIKASKKVAFRAAKELKEAV